jgi:phosphoribosylamine-glycine ligase
VAVVKAAVIGKDGRPSRGTGSRAIGFVGVGAHVEKADAIAEAAARAVEGPAAHRRDIGTAALIARRSERMRRLGTP